MKLRSFLLGTAAAGSLGGVAQAAHLHGWYVGLEGGANWVESDGAIIIGHVSTTPHVFVTTANFSFNTGWAILATVGYGFDSHWRIEGEVGYRANKIDQATTEFGFPIVTGGRLNELTLMANVLYDFPLTDKLMFTLGAGAGADHADFKTTGPFQDAEWQFAYQGEAGFSYAISSRADLTLNYRYLRVSNPDFRDHFGPVDAEIPFGDFVKHTVTVGVRYALQPQEEAPPPPSTPPPLPPGMDGGSFVIFFGFNKCNVTAEADSVLSEAASQAKRWGSAHVTIVGYTDTSGSPKYNQRLSECRANAAKSNLVGKGIPEGTISASGKGETELMVQTGDGVKEPQNRRATIDLH